MKIRIKFTKQGAVKFVGHLDIMRYFQKAIRRADVDIRYSEGFSPHQIMSFAAPLGVGLTSNGEYMDIEVNSTDNSQVMTERLNREMAEGVRVISYRKLDDSSKNAMSIVAAADYTLTFREAFRPADPEAFMKAFEEFCGRESIPVMKKTKKSEKEIDIRPMIYEVRAEGEQIFLKLSTGSEQNLKPELVMEAFAAVQQISLPEFSFHIQREEVYTSVEDESGRRFLTLEDLGEEIG